MAYKKPFKITAVNLSEKCKNDPDLYNRLCQKKAEIDCLSIETTKLVREARVAAAKAQIAIAEVEMAVLRFMAIAGDVDTQIAREPSAMAPYYTGGELFVDIPFGLREQRMAVRAAHNQLVQQSEDDSDSELFDEGVQD